MLFYLRLFGKADDHDLELGVIDLIRLQHLVVLLHGLAVLFDVVDVVVSADLGVWSRQVTFDLRLLDSDVGKLLEDVIEERALIFPHLFVVFKKEANRQLGSVKVFSSALCQSLFFDTQLVKLALALELRPFVRVFLISFYRCSPLRRRLAGIRF